jgi:hypothetical protein
VILNLLLSLFGIRQFAHYCCDERSEAYFTAPSCDCEEEGTCEEEEESDCCKNEVKVAQLVQDGISSQKSEISKPIFVSLFTINTNQEQVCVFKTNSSVRSSIDEPYKSPPIYLKNRLLLI